MAQYIRPNTAPGFGMPMATNFQAPSTVQWVITADERRNYDTQFNNLMPVAGFLSGDQARNFLLQCNLPPVILGRIWELADITGDGKMDKHEFAIAMKLIKMKLQGVELPIALPQSMKPTGFGAPGGLMNTGFGTNVPNGRSTPGYPAASISPLNTASPQMIPKTSLSRHSSLNEGSSRPGQEWAIPKHTKLKYNQLFNSNDRTKTGYMSGMQARHILNGTGVAQMVLAKIWQLSDIDNDGKLSQEEFVLAMHLTDVAKSGNQIPVVLPANLIPPSYRPNKSTSSGQLGLLTPLNAMEAKVEDSMMDGGGVFASFEDRRRENFQKGNLELEKRRIALLESQQKEKHRIEQQERDIREKREKERQEQERKRQEEIERQREQLRAVEREREEQKRKALEQKESAQREMERQRQLEWERLRRKELLQLKLREQESVTSLRAKTKTLDVELNTLLEKRKQLQARAQDFESRLREQNMELEAVNKQRELKHTLVQRQQEQIQHIQQQLNAMHPEKQSLSERIQFKGSGSGHDENVQLAQRDYQSKVFTLQRLRVQLDDSDKKKHDSSVRLEQLSSQLNKLREELNKQMLATEDRSRTQQDKIRLLQEARRQKDITLIRKNSMTENKKQQERIANAALMRKRENEAHREAEEMELKRRQQQQQLQQEQQRRIEEQQKLEGERRENERKREEERRESERKKEEERRESDRKRAEERRLAEEMAKKKEEEAKRKAEEEQKKAEVKMKILQMQEERRKQKIIEKSEPPAHGFTLNLSKDPNHLFKYKALYSFTARNPDELTIQTGDVIIVDESQDVEPDWLAGNKNGKVGWFPANYVEKIKTTATPTPAAVMPPPQSAKPIKKTTTTNSAISSKSSAFSAAQKSAPTNLKPPDIGQRYRAIYPWIAKKDNHLSFNKDDIIAVSEHQEMWWFGHCKGKSGWFPKSYVKETTSTTPITTPKPASPKSSPLVKRKAPAPPMGSAAPKKNYAAVFAFTGTESGDLSFDVGDVIDVTSTDGEWWTGSLRGKSGIFPANYVAESAVKVPETPQPNPQTASLPKPEVATVIANYQASGAEQLSLQVGQICLIRKKNDSGWWEGELQARGKKRQVGWFPANYVKIMSNTASSGTPTPSESAKPKSTPSSETQVMAMYDYSAQNSDELSFQRGSIIMVHDQSDVDWWKGTTGGATGLFPSNYVQEIPADQSSHAPSQPTKINEYHQRVMEVISSEENYLKDLQLADNAFQQPLRDSKLVSEQDANTLFVNLNELIMTSAKLVKALRVRFKMSGDNVNSIMIGDILCEQIPHMHPYIRFCSCQLNASSLLQELLDSNPEFKALVKKCESGDLWKGLPVSSYLVKPMQRVTKYPLLIKKIVESTPEDHPDHRNLITALGKSEELCSQVNEGVRQKENSDRLEWLQTHVQLDGLNDKLVFNSKTNCLDQRRFIYCGNLYKHKSNKELVGFLFNDFLLLTTPHKPLSGPTNDLVFTSKSNPQFRMYKTPIFLNEVLTRLPTDPSDEPTFHLSHIDHVYTLKAENNNERTAWMNKIKEAADLYIFTEKKKREKAYQARTQRNAGIGRLVVTIVEGCNLVKTSNGRHDPYCEVTMGEQSHTTKTVQDTLNPKWGSTMQFYVKDVNLDVLCISVFQRYMFSPDDFLGRTEVKISDIQKEGRTTKGPITKRLLLHEVDAGEVLVKLDLLFFDS